MTDSLDKAAFTNDLFFLYVLGDAYRRLGSSPEHETLQHDAGQSSHQGYVSTRAIDDTIFTILANDLHIICIGTVNDLQIVCQ